jgi:hypothetical protein
MTHIFRHLWRVLRNQDVLGATAPQVRKNFLVCHDCRRIVPIWRLVAHRPTRRGMGCRCGCQDVQIRQVSQVRAVWWLVVRGYLIRFLLLGKRDEQQYDPRIASDAPETT